jgi:pimeloyl-ACP methyl ester carboxylesterase
LARQIRDKVETPAVAKALKPSVPAATVRTRRAYFDCKFGQLHVRTAFPTTGGFDEQVTLFCLHPIDGTSRTFSRILPELADVRSVYAPDLPGCGESDPSPTSSSAEAAGAVSDLANDLRLRQIDVWGVQFGAAVALELAVARPELVRRLVLAGVPAPERIPPARQKRLVVDLPVNGEDLSAAAGQTLAKQLGAFLRGEP